MTLYRSADHKCRDCPYLIRSVGPAWYVCQAYGGKERFNFTVTRNMDLQMPDRQDWCPLPVGILSTENVIRDHELIRLFHVLWTKAVGTKEYKKKEWQELASMLLKYRIIT